MKVVPTLWLLLLHIAVATAHTNHHHHHHHHTHTHKSSLISSHVPQPTSDASRNVLFRRDIDSPEDDYTCGPDSPCKNKACCGPSNVCGLVMASLNDVIKMEWRRLTVMDSFGDLYCGTGKKPTILYVYMQQI